MNAPAHTLAPPDDWLLANQRALVAEFARLLALLRADSAAADPTLAPAALAIPATAIDQLVQAFDLSPFERDILLLAAGVEMDAALAAAVAQASPSGLNFSLALAALPQPHWSALGPQAPLRRWRLLELEPAAAALSTSRLRIDERILHLLAGINELDARLLALLQPRAVASLIAPAQAAQAEQLTSMLVGSRDAPCTVLLSGNDRQGQADVAASVAQGLGLSLHVMASSDLPAGAAEQQALAMLWQREALLLGSALCVQAEGTAGDAAPLARWLARLSGLVFVCASEPLALPHRVALRIDKPGAQEQRSLWQAALGPAGAVPAALLDAVAAQFRFSAQEVAERARAPQLPARLWQDCCEAARPRLAGLAQRVQAGAGWADLVLPEPQLQTLRHIGEQLRHRLTVYGHWGFERQGTRGLGLSALFVGDSGVGKTLACEVLAHELHLDLYRIDLSAVVSKYIGETEKNLRLVFDAAEDSGAILLFDEADALFGKRSEVKDSHDRYANIEVGYLLQRMEAYRGLAVLTTNQRAALDPAFLRRLRFVVEFAFPDQAQREAIWRGVFPPAMPRSDIHYGQLARLPMAGGHIRNIALNAAFLAAAEGTAVGMQHLARAAHQEAAKIERPLADNHTRGWA